MPHSHPGCRSLFCARIGQESRLVTSHKCIDKASVTEICTNLDNSTLLAFWMSVSSQGTHLAGPFLICKCCHMTEHAVNAPNTDAQLHWEMMRGRVGSWLGLHDAPSHLCCCQAWVVALVAQKLQWSCQHLGTGLWFFLRCCIVNNRPKNVNKKVTKMSKFFIAWTSNTLLTKGACPRLTCMAVSWKKFHLAVLKPLCRHTKARQKRIITRIDRIFSHLCMPRDLVLRDLTQFWEAYFSVETLQKWVRWTELILWDLRPVRMGVGASSVRSGNLLNRRPHRTFAPV